MTPASAPETRGLCQEQLDRMLAWLDPDRHKAGEKYELIRKRLVRLFGFKGAADSDALADRTIDRVAGKLSEIDATYSGDPTRYFCGVAWMVFWEYRRNQAPSYLAHPEPDVTDEKEFASLEECLEELNPPDRDLVLSFYEGGREDRQESRKKIAEQIGWKTTSLRVRATKIRSGLMKCVTGKLTWWQRHH